LVVLTVNVAAAAATGLPSDAPATAATPNAAHRNRISAGPFHVD
jgi:hypothetical protein